MARKKGSLDYPREIELQAIQTFEEEGETQSEITKMLWIRNPLLRTELVVAVPNSLHVTLGKSLEQYANGKLF